MKVWSKIFSFHQAKQLMTYSIKILISAFLLNNTAIHVSSEIPAEVINKKEKPVQLVRKCDIWSITYIYVYYISCSMSRQDEPNSAM